MQPSDSEKQCLIQPRMEPLDWTSCQEDKLSDSTSESSEEVSSVLDLWNPEPLCQETETMSKSDADLRRSARRKLYTACILTLVFMIGELIGGYAAHSLAIMTDAAHLLTDFGSILISIFSLWISSRPPTHTMTFGWHRAEILGMLSSVVSIWALTAMLVWSAIQRITDGDYDINSQIMLITSGCAVAINILMVLILHQSGVSHGHSHGSSTEQLQKDRAPEKHGNASVRAAFIHVVGDLLQSLGVLVAAAIIHLWPEYKVADPICTFLFSVLVLVTTFPVTKDVLRILMEGTPQNINLLSVRKSLLSVHGVVTVYGLHTWSLNMNKSLVSVHVVTEEAADSHIVLTRATNLLRSKFGFSSVTIQVEHSSSTVNGVRTMTVESD